MMKTILGIDPGLSEVGFGIVQVNNGRAQYVDCGFIRTDAGLPLSERLTVIKADLLDILRLHRFAGVGVEDLFFVKNITNGMKVAHARGVILQTIHERGVPLFEFKPSEIKSNICGSGSADKRQVQEMVKRLLNLNKLPTPHDAADALAAALCTAQFMMNQKLI
jgi:crossover junction endodeoxyribonuclease RuvC